MNLKQKIEEAIIVALKSHDELAVSTLRMLKAGINNAEIAKQKELIDEEVIEAIQKEIKNRRESISAFKAGNREDLATKEAKELGILNLYLPAQMSQEELKKIVSEVVTQLNAKPADFGKVMGEVMAKVKGKADGGLVAQVVKESLSG